MRSHALKPFLWLSTFILIVSLACNIGASSTPPTPTPEPPPPATQEPVVEEPTVVEETEEPTVEATKEVVAPEESGAVSTLGDVEKAVIRIIAEGTFVDPEVGWEIGAGKAGSGFIIDPSGIAVTNNHVVTGAGLLQVWVGGEKDPRNARVLGVSECSDLAVIDIEGGGYPYLEWYDGDATVGLRIYAAGYPLNPEYNLTEGIVSKAETIGESSWASVDSMVEHSAKINPGSSGGPLVTEDGKLIGVNYALNSDTDQNFAIARNEAVPILEDLQSGKNVDSVGINGAAVSGEVNGLPIFGVWVRSVASGSPADKALIEPGDIIWEMEGKPLAEDGTMSDYCDVLRSHRSSDTMSLTVIRYTETDLPILEGQLNGRELELTGVVFGGGSTGSTDGPGTNEEGNLEFVDQTGTIYVEVPGDWADSNGDAWIYDNVEIGVAISAAPNLDDFWNYYDAPGVFFGASSEFARYGGYVQFLDYYVDTEFNYSGNCTLEGRYNYNDGLYRGKYDSFYNCGGPGGYDAYVLSAVSTVEQLAYIIIIAVQVPKGETAPVELIWDTFLVGEP